MGFTQVTKETLFLAAQRELARHVLNTATAAAQGFGVTKEMATLAGVCLFMVFIGGGVGSSLSAQMRLMERVSEGRNSRGTAVSALLGVAS